MKSVETLNENPEIAGGYGVVERLGDRLEAKRCFRITERHTLTVHGANTDAPLSRILAAKYQYFNHNKCRYPKEN